MSSVNNKFISNKETVPVFETDIFSGLEDKRFALGVFDSDSLIQRRDNDALHNYLKFRANVYIDQTGMLPESSRLPDGTEVDLDDERSVHFIVLENKIGRAALFACMRLVEKIDRPLPIEEYFPDSFNLEAPEQSVEVSRFIVRHGQIRSGLMAKKDLMAAGLAYVLRGRGSIYGVVEPNFERDLKMMKIPLRRITEPKFVAEYNDYNLGFEIDRYELRQRLGEDAIRRFDIPVNSYTYWGVNTSDSIRISDE